MSIAGNGDRKAPNNFEVISESTPSAARKREYRQTRSDAIFLAQMRLGEMVESETAWGEVTIYHRDDPYGAGERILRLRID